MTDSEGRSLNISLTAYVTAALSKAQRVINSVSLYFLLIRHSRDYSLCYSAARRPECRPTRLC